MKVLIQVLAARLQRLSPPAMTVAGLCCVLGLGVIDYFTPGAMSFVLFYMLVAVLVGWGAGKWQAMVVSVAAVMTLATVQWGLQRGAPQTGWVVLWNSSTRLLVFGLAGWLTAEVTRLTRHLSQLVEERTAQWKAEAEQHRGTAGRLAEALERFEQVINNITEVFWLTDVAKSRMVYISPGYERIWGRNCDELYREPGSWVSAVHPEDRELIKRQALTEQAGGSYDVEYRIIRPDGTVRWIRDRAFPVRDPQGEVYRIAGIAQDITERRRSREMLQTQAAILENMAEGVVVTDEQGLIVQMNPAAERIWGYERGEVMGQAATVFSALPESEAVEAMREVLATLRATGTWRGTFKNRRKDSGIILCEAVINRLELPDRVLLVAVEQDVTERQRAQEQLQIQARVLESMAEAVLMVDEQGTIILTNPALDALFGYERGELQGKPVSNVLGYSPKEFRRGFDSNLGQIQAHGSAAGEYVARRKDGSVIEVETRSSAISFGSRLCLVVVGQDITERRRAEKALRQSEESLRAFLDAVPEPALLLDREGIILLANQTLARNLGVPEAQLVGRYAFGLLPPRVAEARKAMFDRAVRTRQPTRHEDARAGRHYLGFECPVLDPAGNVTRVAVFALDITERKEAELALARQEALYRTLFELSPDGILLEDTDGNILDANRGVCHAFGYSREELLRQNVRCFVPPDNQGEVDAHLAALRAGKALEHEVWNVRKNGSRCLMKLNEKPLALPNGRQGVLVVTRDITESKRAELTKEALLSLGTKLGAASSPAGVARAIYACADLLWKWDCGTLDVCLPESDQVETVLAWDVVDGQRREVAPPWRVGPGSGRMRRIMDEGAELILRKPNEIPTDDFLRVGDTSRLSASLMYVPVHQEGRTVGMLSIQSYTPYAYTQEDLRTLQALADYCGGALERIRAETALRESEELLRAFYDSPGGLRGVVELLEDDMLILSANAPHAAVYGRTIEGMRHARATELGLPQPVIDLWLDNLRQSQKSDAPITFEYSTDFRSPGSFALATACPLHVADSARPRFAYIALDITERKRAEAALREDHDKLEARVRQRTAELQSANAALHEVYGQLERRVQERTAELQAANVALGESEERYRSLVTNLNVGVYRNTPGPHGRFIHANPALARIHGYESVEELLNLSVADLYQEPGDRKVFMDELLLQGAVVKYELRAKKKDGTAIYGSVNATAHRGLDGEVDWIDGTIEDITERKKAEIALRVSEERYRTLAESSPDAIFILDRDIKVQYVNSTAAALWRRKAEKLIGVTQSDLFPPEVANYHVGVVEEVFRTGKSVRRDEPLTFPTGDQWIEIRLAPLYGEADSVTSVMGVCRDITERKRAERQLADALDLNQKMLSVSTIGIAAYKATGECIFANEAMTRMVGGSRDEMLKNNFRQSEVWRKSGKCQLAEEVLQRGEARFGEFYGTSRFGRTCWQDCHLATFVSAGEPHLLEIASEITERKEAEETLRQSEARVRAIITGAPVVLFAVDGDGIIRFEDGQALNALGSAPGANVGRSILEVYAHVPGIVENARRALLGEEFESIIEAGPVTFDCWYSPTRDHDGSPAGFIGVATNITERHQLERQILEISDREQARIGQDIHDGLCQHLVSLGFDANALQRELSAQRRPEAKKARRIVEFLDHAITEARQLARGLFPVRLETEGLPPALEELAKATCARFKIRCRFASRGSVAVKNASVATHLYRIAQEAVTNAVKHSRAGSVSIRLRARAGKIELRVADNGTGLSAATGGSSSGLGLHIMDYRARTIGGALSLRPGRRGGTIVSCCAPSPED